MSKTMWTPDYHLHANYILEHGCKDCLSTPHKSISEVSQGCPDAMCST